MQYFAALVVFFVVSQSLRADPARAPANSVKEPETELELIKTDLNNWSRRLDANENLNGRLGLGPQTASAERSWSNALEFFSHKEWTSAIREFNNFLNQTQVPEIKSYLKAQYMLGLAYEGLQYKEKALRAYFRYLSSFLTAESQDHEELIDVLRRMIPLSSSVGNKNELRQLLASITSLDLPQDVQPLIYYYVAKAAANAGEDKIATTWFERAAASPNDPVIKAKSMYMLAILALGRKEFDLAEDILGQVILIDKDDSTRDLGRLALARLAVKQRKRETSLKLYKLIDADSIAFKDAVFESVYVHLDLKQDGEARAKSLLYLSRWPDGPDALQIRMLLAYLDMRAGDLKSARESIVAADKRLNDIKAWLYRNLGNQATINQTTLDDISSMTGAQLPVPPSVRVSAEFYSRLAELSRRLTDIRGSVRNTIFTVGRANIDDIRPFWVNKSTQLGSDADELLKIGHRLIAVERHLYETRISEIDKQRLDASFNRRASLLSSAAVSHRRASNWESFTTFAGMTKRLADASVRLNFAQAEIASSQFLSDSMNKGKAFADPKARLTELRTRSGKLQEYVAKSLEAVRRRRVSDLLNDSPHRASGRFFASYSAALVEEEGVLAKIRDKVASPAERLNADDIAKSWEQWRFLASTLFKQMETLDRDIGSGLSSLLSDLDGQERRFDELNGQLNDVTNMLANHLGQTLSSIVDQYSRAISERFARNQKWQGDIDYLNYKNSLEEDKKLQERNNLEQQILRDNLLGLQQGALWQWPN
jgi:hypothetical protein